VPAHCLAPRRPRVKKASQASIFKAIRRRRKPTIDGVGEPNYSKSFTGTLDLPEKLAIK
jgi:hypothetical protein